MTRIARPDRYQMLLDPVGVTEMPIATPLDLAQLPIVRPTQALDATTDEDGNLPVEAWEIRTWQTDPGGIRREVVIRGSRTEGLPYGRDGDVLLALSHIIAENGYYDGVLEEISLQRIAAAIGKDLDGKEARRIVSALSRFAGVQIEITMPLVEPEDVSRLLRGEADPHPPPRVRSRKVRRAKFSLLRFVWDTETLEHEDGSTTERVRIRHLALEPLLVHYAIAGGVAWIDREAFMAVGDSPIARSLYQFAASEVARGHVGPWQYDMLELRDTLGMNANHKPSRVRALLENAAELLRQQRVLAEFRVEKQKGRGRYQVEMVPGPLLGVARLLRGVGLHELAETRKQLLLLGHLGIHNTTARRLIRESPNDVYLALAYLKYMEETQPREAQIDSPAGWLISTLRKGIPLDTDQPFVRWLQGRIVAVEHEEPSLPFAPPIPKPVQAAPARRSAAELLPARDAEAAAVWGRAVREFLAGQPSRWVENAMLEMAPFALEGDTLVLRTPNSWAREWLIGKAQEELRALLADHTEGRVTELRILSVEEPGELVQGE